MPKGVYDRNKTNKIWHCKKCPKVTFTNMSDLRKHQWAVHTETFANLIVAAQKPEAIEKAKKTKEGRFKDLIPSVRELKNGDHIVLPLPGQIQGPDGDMKVSELLKKLRDQRQFMIDVVNLIEGLIK